MCLNEEVIYGNGQWPGFVVIDAIASCYTRVESKNIYCHPLAFHILNREIEMIFLLPQSCCAKATVHVLNTAFRRRGVCRR